MRSGATCRRGRASGGPGRGDDGALLRRLIWGHKCFLMVLMAPFSRDVYKRQTLDRVSGAVGHHHFYDLPDFLNPGDCLILNDSRVQIGRAHV